MLLGLNLINCAEDEYNAVQYKLVDNRVLTCYRKQWTNATDLICNKGTITIKNATNYEVYSPPSVPSKPQTTCVGYTYDGGAR